MLEIGNVKFVKIPTFYAAVWRFFGSSLFYLNDRFIFYGA